MTLGGRPDRRQRRGESTPPLSRWAAIVSNSTSDGGEQPVEHERQERQLEHVEPDIDAELVVGATERALLRNSSHSCQCDVAGNARMSPSTAAVGIADETQSTAEHLVEALDDGMHVGREVRGGQAVGDGQVETRDHQEGREEHPEQEHLGTDDAPEHVASIERVVPQRVDVDAGDGPPEHQDDQRQRADGQSHRAARRSPARPRSRQIGGTRHRVKLRGARRRGGSGNPDGPAGWCDRSGNRHRRSPVPPTSCPRSPARRGRPDRPANTPSFRRAGMPRRLARRRPAGCRRAPRRCAGTSTRDRAHEPSWRSCRGHRRPRR